MCKSRLIHGILGISFAKPIFHNNLALMRVKKTFRSSLNRVRLGWVRLVNVFVYNFTTAIIHAKNICLYVIVFKYKFCTSMQNYVLHENCIKANCIQFCIIFVVTCCIFKIKTVYIFVQKLYNNKIL